MQSQASPAALLEKMMLVRAFELQNAALAAASQAPGTCTSVGQEAASVGVVVCHAVCSIVPAVGQRVRGRADQG